VPDSSYIPGIVASEIGAVLDAAGLLLSARMRLALREFGRRLPGYVSEDAVLVGVESRTSSPVRIARDPESLLAPGLPGLYPAAEGAGYAGGIVSAAMDGIRIAQALAMSLTGK
jgi:uncharacterized protein